MIMKTLITAGALAVASFVSGSAVQAATCNDGTYVSTLTPSTACYAYGDGNVNGNPAQDPILNAATMGGNTINFVSAPISGIAFLGAAAFVGGGTSTTKTAEFSILASMVSGYDNIVAAVKFGNQWASFTVAGAGDYDFSVTPKQGAGVSHVNIYGTVATANVPLPAGGLLLISALGGAAALRRRAKKA